MTSDEQRRPTLAVAIPAYNEEGLREFLQELDEELAPVTSGLSFFVVDDAGSVSVEDQLDGLAATLRGDLHIERNGENSGHGPTVRRAYELALESGAELVLQVDGDGQFEGADCHLLIGVVAAGADVAAGVRDHRTDPWFRKGLSRGLRVYLRALFGVTSADPNCPFRLYRRDALAQLLAEVPAHPLVPTVYLTALAGRSERLRVVEVTVRHRVRRGDSAQGTMWGPEKRPLMIPKRLRSFVRRALVESLDFARTHRRSAGLTGHAQNRR